MSNQEQVQKASLADKAIAEEIYKRVLNFIKKTTFLNKDFKKVSKKVKTMDKSGSQKYLRKWARKNLLPIWEKEVAPLWVGQGGLKYLTESELMTYILGLYVSGHSKEVQSKLSLPELIIVTIQEMTELNQDKMLASQAKGEASEK